MATLNLKYALNDPDPQIAHLGKKFKFGHNINPHLKLKGKPLAEYIFKVFFETQDTQVEIDAPGAVMDITGENGELELSPEGGEPIKAIPVDNNVDEVEDSLGDLGLDEFS